MSEAAFGIRELVVNINLIHKLSMHWWLRNNIWFTLN